MRWTTRPLFHEHASPEPITIPPTNAKLIPITTGRVSGSRKKKGESSATHNGPVLTKTTELATVVYSSDEIQVAK